MPPSSSPSSTRRARRPWICGKRCATARRRSGRRRPAISRSTGRDRRRTRTPTRRRSSASSRRAAHVARVSRRASAHHGPLDGAARRDRELRSLRPKAICCAAARKARAPCATAWRRSSALPNERLRVVTEDVGGAFGLKTGPYPEYLAILVAARKLGRPVHWMSSRAGGLPHRQSRARRLQRGRACARRAGKVPRAAHPPPRQYGRLYRRGRRQPPDAQSHALPARHVRHPAHRHRRALRVHQHDADRRPIAAPAGRRRTTCSSAWSTRPRASPASIRSSCAGATSSRRRRCRTRRRSAPPIDSGEFAAILDKALALADYDGFKQRRREAAKARQVPRPRHFMHARACRRVSAGRRGAGFPGGEQLVLGLNVQSTGQGHATVFTPMLAERLGIAPDAIEHRHGDSAMEIAGYASVGSRSAMTVESRLIKTVEAMLAKGKSIAATVLEAADADIEYRDGQFRRRGHRPPHRAVRSRGARRRDEEARRNCRRPRHQNHCRDAADVSRTAATSPRWRSIPIPASWRSSPTRRSTTAATCSTT